MLYVTSVRFRRSHGETLIESASAQFLSHEESDRLISEADEHLGWEVLCFNCEDRAEDFHELRTFLSLAKDATIFSQAYALVNKYASAEVVDRANRWVDEEGYAN